MSGAQRPQADWYFDIISPYAYLQAEQLSRLDAHLRIRHRPVLFAGLLNHWGQKGPAEIPSKRRFTFRYVLWRGARQGLALKAPPAHPFNPLKLLRLVLVLDCSREAVLEIFRFVWRDGCSADDPPSWAALCDRLGVRDADARIVQPQIKEALRRNVDDAIAAGVFGVPTLMVNGELFWGDDATDMAIDFMSGHPIFSSAEMARIETLSEAASRLTRS
jgi:2-hydroxychromene-2-carboxylate isomerase